jgi:hypothetical protein
MGGDGMHTFVAWTTRLQAMVPLGVDSVYARVTFVVPSADSISVTKSD